MNHIPVHQHEQEINACNPTMRAVERIGTMLFLLGIFLPGAHSLVMLGLALMAIGFAL
jgi:membrane-bound ClpP family serine protease